MQKIVPSQGRIKGWNLMYFTRGMLHSRMSMEVDDVVERNGGCVDGDLRGFRCYAMFCDPC